MCNGAAAGVIAGDACIVVAAGVTAGVAFAAGDSAQPYSLERSQIKWWSRVRQGHLPLVLPRRRQQGHRIKGVVSASAHKANVPNCFAGSLFDHTGFWVTCATSVSRLPKY